MAKAITREKLLGLTKKREEEYMEGITTEIKRVIKELAYNSSKDETRYSLTIPLDARYRHLKPIIYANLKEIFPDSRVLVNTRPYSFIQKLFCRCRHEELLVMIDWS